MATKFICDKCHSESINKNHLKHVSLPHYDSYREDEYVKEICDICLRKLHDWLKPDPIMKER